MQDINVYWKNKEKRARIARQHTKIVGEKYKKEIFHSICKTFSYNESSYFPIHQSKYDTVIEIKDADSVTAILEENNIGRLMVLNFASYKEAGGKFMDGSSAQEESLCHESFLYNVLCLFKNYYANNNLAKNKALYKNRALYSRDIIFERNEKNKMCDVLTCAAPNYTAAKKYCNVRALENLYALKSRCEFVLNICAEQKAETLILGGYGCGVFGQNPKEVANIFKHLLENKFNGVFRKVIFAIPQDKNKNLDSFKEVFE